MKRILIAWIAGLTAVAGSGCGTVCNFAGGLLHPDTEPRPYGGVRRDIEILEGVSSNPPCPSGPSCVSGDGRGAALCAAGYVAIMVADPVLSFAADTLTLPLTVYLEHRREAAYHTDTETGISPNAAPETAWVTPDKLQPVDRAEPGSAWAERLLSEMPLTHRDPPATGGATVAAGIIDTPPTDPGHTSFVSFPDYRLPGAQPAPTGGH